MPDTNRTTSVLTLDLQTLTDADLYKFIAAVTGLINRDRLTSDASDHVITMLHDAEDEYFNRPSATPEDALRKVVHLAHAEISSEFMHGPAVVAGAAAALSKLEDAA